MNMIIPLVIGSILLVSAPFVSSKISINNFGQGSENNEIVSNQKVVEYEIKSGDIFPSILESFQISYDDAVTILNSSKDVFDFTKIQTGKVLKFIFVNKALASIQYPLSSDEVIIVQKKNDAFIASKETIQYEIKNTAIKGTINDSLFLSGQNVGLDDKVIMELADIFSSDIDFTTDIHEGDSFSLVYQKRSLDGKDAGSGKILAARFVNDEKIYTAFRYDDKFYDSDGQSLARQFLKSPLSYARISSGYSNSRANPVTKQVTPHRAIDYAAPEGTPVIATANGKVSIAGSKGGLGITVEIKHGNYLTQYAHLSRIAKGIKSGIVVNQGDVVGYVGSTGISTGSHLQYAMFQNSNPINPLTADFSRGESIKESEKTVFNKTRDSLQNLLD